MLTIVNVSLLLGLIAVIVMTVYLGSQMASGEHFLFILVLFFTGLILLGSFMEYNASSSEAALEWNKVAYLGRCYAEYALLAFTLRFLGIKVSRWKHHVLIFIHTVIYIAVAFCDRHTWFCKSYDYRVDAGIYHIVETAGPLLYIHKLMMLFYIIVIPWVSISFAIQNSHDWRKKNAIALSLCAIVPASTYVMNIMGMTGDLDFTPMAFVGAVLVTYFLVIRGHLFDAVDIAKTRLIDSLDDAVIVVNGQLQVLYMNDVSKTIFTDVNGNMEASNLIKSILNTAQTQFERNNRTYDIHVSEIRGKDRTIGYSMVFVDVTDLVDHAGMLEREVDKKRRELEKIQHQVIISFANIVEMRDDTTGQHVKRTTEYVKAIAKELMVRQVFPEIANDDDVDRIASAAALHDIGKIAISDSILRKPGKLTDEEFDEIKTHSSLGGFIIHEILEDVGYSVYLDTAMEMAVSHHEKWDGTGYPKGLRGTEIPISARIMAIADVFDALISKRQYKEAFSLDKAFAIIEDSAGKHFDPTLVEVFLEMRPEIEKIVETFKDGM